MTVGADAEASAAVHHPGHSVLQVPVPPLEGWVRARTAHYDTDYLSSDPDFTHAHITVLAPFLLEVDDHAAAAVEEAVADTADPA